MQIPSKYRRVKDLPSLPKNFVLLNGAFPRAPTPLESMCEQIQSKFSPMMVTKIDEGLTKTCERKDIESAAGKDYEVFRMDKVIESLRKKKLKPIL